MALTVLASEFVHQPLMSIVSQIEDDSSMKQKVIVVSIYQIQSDPGHLCKSS